MRYAPNQKQVTRQRILHEACRTIRCDGLHNLGVASVMAQVGLTHGGFYAHFASREDLVVASVDQLFHDARPSTILRNETRTPTANLNAFLRFYLSPEHRDSQTYGCPLALLSTDAPRLPDKAAERFLLETRHLSDLLARNLEAMGRLNPDDEAGSILAELIGAISLARAAGVTLESDQILQRSHRAICQRLQLAP